MSARVQLTSSILIRGVQPGDSTRLLRHFDRMSAATIRLRFFTTFLRPSSSLLRALLHVEHGESESLVALHPARAASSTG